MAARKPKPPVEAPKPDEEGQVSHGDGLALERMVLFSDAVFAIAITLLVIEIRPPHLSSYNLRDEASALVELLPQFLAYALSFLVIARFWMGHHTAFSMIRHFDPKLIWPNMQFLMGIAFLPFATAFWGDNFTHMLPMIFYNVSLLIVALLSFRLIRRTVRLDNLRPEYGPADIRNVRKRGLPVIIGALSATILLFFVPGYGQFLLFGIPIWMAVADRLARRTPPPVKQS